jgi:hypothetical protein
MPQCPHCQTAYEPGARYCSVCGSFLLHPEEGDTFCPQCGVRVSPKQEFCHECDSPLKKPAEAVQEPAAVAEPPRPEPAPSPPPPAAPSPPPPAAGGAPMQPWVIGLLSAAGAIIILLIVLLFLKGVPTPPPAPLVAPKAEAPAAVPPAAPTPAPAPAPEAQVTGDLRMELLGVLSTLREANLKKDINLYLSVYSPQFPNLEEKRKNMLKIWETYDYPSIVFTLDDIKPVDTNNLDTKATWYLDAKNRSTGATTSVKQTYQIRFTKEHGKWRIRSLEELGEEE